MDFDLLIRGGTIVDGTGAPERKAGDVAIRDGRIAAVGKVSGKAARTIDADGPRRRARLRRHPYPLRRADPLGPDAHDLAVARRHDGRHGELRLRRRADAARRIADLILRTLEKVEGMSLAALEAGLGEEWRFETFPQYLDAIERRGAAINVGALVGHTPVRLYVMGEAATERAATEDEVAAMRAIVREAVSAGAIGFATSKSPTHVGYEGRPVPSRAAELERDRRRSRARSATLGRGVVQATVGTGLPRRRVRGALALVRAPASRGRRSSPA